MITIDSDGSSVGDARVEEVPGVVTPYTYPDLDDTLSQLHTPLTKSSLTVNAQPHTQHHAIGLGSQLPGSAGLWADSGRDTMAEVLQRVLQLERLVLHEGHLSGVRGVRSMSTTWSGENPFETQSDSTSAAPPTYRE